MAMHCFTQPQVPSLSAGFEGGRVGVGVAFGIRRRFLHLGVEEKRLMRHVIADETDDNGVPEDCRWARNCLEQLAGEMGLTFLTNTAEPGTDCGCLRFGIGVRNC